VVVSRTSVEVLAQNSTPTMPLHSAAAALGIKRQRLSKLLPQICPAATKTTAMGTPWEIPTAWVNTWLARLGELIRLAVPLADGFAPLDQVLRFWPINDHEFGRLLADIECGALQPTGAAHGLGGLAGMVFSHSQIEAYLDRGAFESKELISVPETAERLGVKQEVAYALVKSKLLPVRVHRVGRRDVQLVYIGDLAAFSERYVFARDVAKALGRSSRSLIQALTNSNVRAVASPDANGCRQVVYLATDVKRWLDGNLGF
jgi:predicted DNA-binding transcriptional regulator AlpA